MSTYILGEGPTGDQSGNHKDTYIVTGLFASFSYASDLNFFVASDRLPLMRFDMSAMPAGVTITAATLRLYTAIPPIFGNLTAAIHAVTTAWGVTDIDEGATENPATGGQATHNEASDHNGIGDTHWAAGAGNPFGAGDYRAATDATEVASAAEPVGTVHDIDLTALVAEWYAGTLANHGIVLITADISSAVFDSQSAVNAAVRPSLTVVTTSEPEPTPAFNTPWSRAQYLNHRGII